MCPSVTTLCFPTVQDSLCQVSHWGSISWLVIWGEHSTREQAKTWNAIQNLLFYRVSLPRLWLTNPTDTSTSFLLPVSTSAGKWSISWAELLYLVFGIRWKRETMLLCYAHVRDPGWAVICCNWELFMRGSHSGLCTLAGLTIWKKFFCGFPSSRFPTQVMQYLWGMQPFCVIFCRQLLVIANWKKVKRVIFLAVIIYHLHLVG